MNLLVPEGQLDGASSSKWVNGSEAHNSESEPEPEVRRYYSEEWCLEAKDHAKIWSEQWKNLSRVEGSQEKEIFKGCTIFHRRKKKKGLILKCDLCIGRLW